MPFVDIYRAGSKSGNSHTCTVCRGRGVRVVLKQIGPGMVQQMQMPCNDCNGEGKCGLNHISQLCMYTIRSKTRTVPDNIFLQ
mgnify:CR=1 FL=1